MANVYDMSDTWNDGATTFTSIKMNVTDTASDASSLLMDLQVGGASLFSVTKVGRLKAAKVWTLSNEPLVSETFALGSTDGTSIKGVDSSGQLGFSVGTKYYLGNKNSAFEMNTAVALGWSASPGSGHPSATRSGDLYLFRDAANTLAQRNGVNAQTFNLYNTYTDASNYERGFMSWSKEANSLYIGTEGAGTGSDARSVKIRSAGRVYDFTSIGLSVNAPVANTNFVLIGSSATALWGTGSNFAYFGSSTPDPVEFRTSNNAKLRLDTTGSVEITTGLTVATLPAAPVVGMMARVTDATGPAVGSTVTGGGAAAALCWYNGTNWTVIGV